MTHAAGSEDMGRAPRSWLSARALLIVSLAFNLLFLGLLAGAGWIHWKDDRRSRHFSFSRGLETVIAEMPAERKAVAQGVLDRYRADVRPMWRQVREARNEAFEALRAEPYDAAQAQRTMDRLNEIQLDARQRVRALMLEIMQQLSPEERQAFLRGLTPRERRPRPEQPPQGRR